MRHTDALSKYHILKRLGSGGMAEIYLARSLGIEGFEKYVVLKKILPEHSRNPAFVRMFLDEARLAAKLQHQNIAQVYDIGRIQDGYFFVMEYLHGRDLRSLKREHRKRATRLPIHHALTIAAGAAAGLEYAHNATNKHGKPLGLVHRDVSPSNIVVTFDGAVKLVDFGIARAADKPSETRSGALKGKVPYMSREQCRGQELDGRSDLFSLGVALYELTTGVSPFCQKGDTDYTVLEKICAGEYVKPSELVAGYPEALERILARALDPERDKRYQSARAMLRAIEEAAADLGVPLSAALLADHMRSIYGELPLPWTDDSLGSSSPGSESPGSDGALSKDDDDLLRKTIATGSAIDGVTLFQITPSNPNVAASAVFNSRTSVRPKRTLGWWLLAASVFAGGGIALALSTLQDDASSTPPHSTKPAVDSSETAGGIAPREAAEPTAAAVPKIADPRQPADESGAAAAETQARDKRATEDERRTKRRRRTSRERRRAKRGAAAVKKLRKPIAAKETSAERPKSPADRLPEATVETGQEKPAKEAPEKEKGGLLDREW